MTLPSPPAVAVIGGGPAGLMAAEVCARGGARVSVHERMPSPARKFLLAGRGGLNLTHSEPLASLLRRYGAAPSALVRAVEDFPPAAVRAWCQSLGQPTFVGSSGRVFPVAMKASPLLRAWLARLRGLGVELKLRQTWQGWDDAGRLVFATLRGRETVSADATILALGGASWPRLGSDAAWVDILARAGVAIAPLRPANCGFRVAWSEVFRARFAGHPLKRLALSFEGHGERGEALVTRSGLEGGGIYALSAPLREAIARHGHAILSLDLRPDLALSALEQRLSARPGKQSLASFLRKSAGLSPVEIGLMHEAALATPKRLGEYSAADLARLVKSLPVRLEGTAEIARAISTAGGVAFSALDESFMLRALPGTFLAGEMLDWEAPTGGYLLQACLATGAAAGKAALGYCASRHQAGQEGNW